MFYYFLHLTEHKTGSSCIFNYGKQIGGMEREAISRSAPTSSEISDFTPCAHAQSNILHIKYAEKTDN